MTTAFISYKSEYRPFAQKVREFLRGLGHQTWFDQDDIEEGKYFYDEIDKGLKRSDVVVGIITPEAIKSREVLLEWRYAYNTRGKTRLLLLKHKPYPLKIFHIG